VVCHSLGTTLSWHLVLNPIFIADYRGTLFLLAAKLQRSIKRWFKIGSTFLWHCLKNNKKVIILKVTPEEQQPYHHQQNACQPNSNRWECGFHIS
jgi:hypothetical protein